MRALLTALSLALLAATAHAGNAACDTKAAEKKLAGAAKNSFLKKCEKDAAKMACDAQAAEKKLKGAAKNSFVKKCEKDAGAAPAAAAASQ